MKFLGVVFVLLVAACGFRVNTISADPDVIVLKTSGGNPGPTAQAHCAKYGRTARLQGTDPANSSIYYFACLAGE